MFTPITAHIEIDRVLKRVRKDGKVDIPAGEGD